MLSMAPARAADQLVLSQAELAKLLGVSPAAVSRVVNGGRLPDNSKTLELATLFIRLYRSLDAIIDGEAHVASAWLRNQNAALGMRPMDAIVTIPGLVATLAYLDTRRAVA